MTGTTRWGVVGVSGGTAVALWFGVAEPAGADRVLWLGAAVAGSLAFVGLTTWAYRAGRADDRRNERIEQEKAAEEAEARARRAEIRGMLAHLARLGDPIAARLATEAAAPPGSPTGGDYTPTAGKELYDWNARVLRYLREQPELGQAYVHRFRDAVPGATVGGAAWRPLYGGEDRHNLDTLRGRQARLWEWAEAFR